MRMVVYLIKLNWKKYFKCPSRISVICEINNLIFFPTKSTALLTDNNSLFYWHYVIVVKNIGIVGFIFFRLRQRFAVKTCGRVLPRATL